MFPLSSCRIILQLHFGFKMTSNDLHLNYVVQIIARNLVHQWEVLTFDPSIMRVVIFHSLGREETHFAVTCTVNKMAAIRGTRGKRSIGFFAALNIISVSEAVLRVF